MKKVILSIMVSLAGFAQAGVKADKTPVMLPPPAADDSLGASLYAGYESSYIFRGVKYGDNLVEVGATLPIKLTDKLTFTFAPWFGQLADKNYNELDLVASLGYDTGFGTLSVGYTWYEYAFSGWNTSEPNITFSTAIATFGKTKLNWVTGAYLDVNANGGDIFSATNGKAGWFFETGLNAPIPVTDKLTITPEARISYGDKYYGVSGFNNVVLKVAASYQLTKTASIAPYIGASFAIDSLKDLGVKDYLVGGAILTVNF
jgi:hypothetical protein